MAKPRRAPQHDAVIRPLLLEVAAGFAARPIEVRRVDYRDDPGELVYGVSMPNGIVIIDEAVSRVVFGIHEVLHRIRPGWSETYVRGMTTKLIKGMTRAELDALHEVYLSVRQERKTAKVL